MTLEVLLATMNQPNYDLADSVGLECNAIICNQNNSEYSYTEFQNKSGNVIKWFDLCEKGVGLNRNTALFRSTADIILMADDDVLYDAGYSETVIKWHEKYPDADVILFNVHPNKDYQPFECKKVMKITRGNCGRFGAVRISCKRKSVLKNAICFNTMFGGGCEFSAGEDNMFIRDCIRKGLKIIAVPDYLLSLKEERESTWFKGYNQKFFFDLGASYVFHFGIFGHLLAVVQLVRHRDIWLKDYPLKQAIKDAFDGNRYFKHLQ